MRNLLEYSEVFDRVGSCMLGEILIELRAVRSLLGEMRGIR